MDASYRLKDIEGLLAKLNINRLDIMVVGYAGAGKSGTLDAIMEKLDAREGQGADTEIRDVTVYSVNDKVCFWDMPVPGDTAENYAAYRNKIEYLLAKSYGQFTRLGYIDLVLVLMDGINTDIDRLCDLLAKSVLPNFPHDRILVAINQADLSIKGMCWNAEKNEPDEELKTYLDKNVLALQDKIRETTGLSIKTPVYFSTCHNYNIQSLFDYIFDNIPKERRPMHENKFEEKSKDMVFNVSEPLNLYKYKFGIIQETKTGSFIYSIAVNGEMLYAVSDEYLRYYAGIKGWQNLVELPEKIKPYYRLSFSDIARKKILQYSGNKLFYKSEHLYALLDNYQWLKLDYNYQFYDKTYTYVLKNKYYWLIYDFQYYHRGKVTIYSGTSLDSLSSIEIGNDSIDNMSQCIICGDLFYISLYDKYDKETILLTSANGSHWEEITRFKGGFYDICSLGDKVLIDGGHTNLLYNPELNKITHYNWPKSLGNPNLLKYFADLKLLVNKELRRICFYSTINQSSSYLYSFDSINEFVMSDKIIAITYDSYCNKVGICPIIHNNN